MIFFKISGTIFVLEKSENTKQIYSQTLHLSMSIRLGVEIFGFGKTCRFCAEALDAYGHHIMGCIGQGSKYGIHNCLRKTVFRYATMAGFSVPAFEKVACWKGDVTAKSIASRGNLRHELGRMEGGATTSVSAGRRWGSSERRPIGSNAGRTLFSAKRYAERKRRAGEILERCVVVNVGYEPMVF